MENSDMMTASWFYDEQFALEEVLIGRKLLK